MPRSAWLVCLFSSCSVTWAQSPGNEVLGVAAEKDDVETSSQPHWTDMPVRLCCVGEPAESVLQRLADQCQVRVWVSEQLTDALAETRITMQAERLPAQVAFRWVARLCGAQAVMEGAGVYLGPPADHAVAWTMWCQQRMSSSLGADGYAVPDERATVDLHDASVPAALKRLSESFGVNYVLLPGGAACQDLVTLQAVDASLSDAHVALCQQTALSVSWLDGLFVCGSPQELDWLAPRVARRVDPQAWPGRSNMSAGVVVGPAGTGGSSGDLAAALHLLQQRRYGLDARRPAAAQTSVSH
jgi:hypothetical protein